MNAKKKYKRIEYILQSYRMMECPNCKDSPDLEPYGFDDGICPKCKIIFTPTLFLNLIEEVLDK